MNSVKEPLLLLIGILVALGEGGCAGMAPGLSEAAPAELPVAAVVNAIKCDINDFFYEQQQSHPKQSFRLKMEKGALATIKLNLRVSRGGGLAYSAINVTGTPLQSIISVSPGSGPFSAGVSGNSALAVEVALTMEQSAGQMLDCRDRKMLRSKDLKLKDWLVKFMNDGQSKIISQGPATYLSEIVITTNFEVAASAGISPTIAIVPVFTPPTLNASTAYTHQLQIILKGDNQPPQPPPPPKSLAKNRPAGMPK